MATRICKQCSNEFELSRGKTKNLFCSRSCSTKYNNAGVNRHKNIAPKLCPICSEVISTRANKYCSSDCANLGYRGYLKTKTDLASIPCKNCSVVFLPANRSVQYCSVECSFSFRKQKTVEAWILDPDSATQKNGGLSTPIRKYLIELSGNRCSNCGWDKINPTTGVCPLEVDHIDGDSFNNNPDNLKVVCPNCHALTSTYRALNKGKSTRVYYGSRVSSN